MSYNHISNLRWPRTQSRSMSEATWINRLPPMRAAWIDVATAVVLVGIMVVLYVVMP